MKLYIDKSNVHSFLCNEKGERFDSVLRMIRNHLDVGFNFEKEEARTDEVLMKFITLFTSGRNTTLRTSFTSQVMPIRPLEVNFLNSVYQNKRCILLIDDVNTNQIKKIGNCLLGGKGQELEVLEKLLLNVEDYDFDKELCIGENEFRSWEDISKYNHPFCDFLILDRYILNVDKITFQKNLIELLNQFNSAKETKINIILFTLKQPQFSWNFKEVKELVVNIVKLKTGLEPNFTIVWSNDRERVRHDRHIITNYYWLKSGDSFNYFFATTGRVRTTGDTLNIKSLAKVDNRKAVDLIVERTQQKILDLLSLNPDFIEGDKVSGFLRFTL